MRSLAFLLALLLTPDLVLAAPSNIYVCRFGDSQDDYNRDVAINSENRGVYVGSFFGTTGFSPFFPLVSAGDSDIFLYTQKDGGPSFVTWAQRFGGTGPDAGLGVATDPDGFVLVTGYFSDTMDFGGASLTSAGGTDAFVACFENDGTHVWSLGFGGTGDDRGNSIAVDGLGNVVVVGTFQGTVDIGDGAHVSAGGDDIFVARYSPAGTLLWSQAFGGTGDDNADEVATGPFDGIAVTGHFSDAVDFGGGALTSAGDLDVFVARYAPDGSHVWSQRFGGTGEDAGRAVGVASSGHIFVGGYFTGDVDFGGGALLNLGDQDFFLVRFSASGAHDWSQSGFFDGNDRVEDLDVAPSGYVVVAGGHRELFGVKEEWFFARYTEDGIQQYQLIFFEADSSRDRAHGVAIDALAEVSIAGSFENFLISGNAPQTSAGARDGFCARYRDEEPIPVLVSGPTARTHAEGILLRWSLQGETRPSRVSILRRQGDHAETILSDEFAPGEHTFLDRTVESEGAYSYRLEVDTGGGEPLWSEWVHARMGPTQTVLLPSWPNPFNPRTTLHYRLARQGQVVIDIFDARGRRVRSLDEGVRSGGEHTTTWDGLDDEGRELASGVYTVRLRGAKGAGAQQVTLTR